MGRQRIYEGTLQERKNAASKAWYHKHHAKKKSGVPNITEDIREYNRNYYYTVTKPRREAERLRKAKENGDN